MDLGLPMVQHNLHGQKHEEDGRGSSDAIQSLCVRHGEEGTSAPKMSTEPDLNPYGDEALAQAPSPPQQGSQEVQGLEPKWLRWWEVGGWKGW